MYCTISPSITKSSVNFVEYLDKENSLSSDFVQYLDKETVVEDKSKFFNGYETFSAGEVCQTIDNNCKGLKSKETRFFSITFNPSQSEIKHMKIKAENMAFQIMYADKEKIFTDKDKIVDGLMFEFMQDYTNKAIDNYAKNFGRKSVDGRDDLVWFGRVEKNRYWKKSSSNEVQRNEYLFSQINKINKNKDLEVAEKVAKIESLKKKLILEKDIIVGGRDIPVRDMMAKVGDNYHVHVIVSRKDKTQRISLSPLANAKQSTKHIINGKQCNIGFDRMKYWGELEATFDRSFMYNRQETEKLKYFVDNKKAFIQDDNVVKAKSIIDIQNLPSENEYDTEFDIIKNNKKTVTELATKYEISQNDLLYIKDVAICKLAAKKLLINDENINQEILSILAPLDRRAKIIVPEVESQHTISSERILLKKIEVLTKQDIDNLKVIASYKLKCLNQQITDKKLEFAVKSMEFRYYATGEILVHNVDNKEQLVLDDKYRETGFDFLSDKDMVIIEKQVTKRVSNRAPYSYVKAKQLQRQYSAMLENSYNSRGVVLSDFSQDEINGKFVYSYPALSGDDYADLYTIAREEINLKNNFKLAKEVYEAEVEAVVNRLESGYHSHGNIPVPKNLKDKMVNVDIEKYKFLEGDTLSFKEIQIIDEIAKNKINLCFTEFSEKLKDKKIYEEIYRLQNEYLRTGKIIVPANFDYKHEFIVNSEFILTEKEMKAINVYAEDIVKKRIGEEANNIDFFIKQQAEAFEKEYLTTGEIKISNGTEKIEDNAIKLNPYKQEQLLEQDYENIKKLSTLQLSIEVDNDITDRHREILLYNRIKEIEQLYNINGKIMLPAELSNITGEKYVNSQFEILDRKSLMSINEITEGMAKNRGLVDKELKSYIAGKKSQFYYEYYTTGKITIPANYNGKTHVFENSDVSELSKNDYKVIEESIKNKISKRYINLDDEQKGKILERLIRRTESQFYKQGQIVIEKTDVQNINKNIVEFKESISADTYVNLYKAAQVHVTAYDSTLQATEKERMIEAFVDKKERLFFSNERLERDGTIVLPASEYTNLQKDFVVSKYKAISKNDYDQINLVAQKIATVRGGEEDLVRQYASKMEREYFKTGQINIPNLKDVKVSSKIFHDQKIEYLNVEDIENLKIAAAVSLTRKGELLSTENISAEVDRFEHTYYKYGQVNVPEAKYNNLDKDKFNEIKKISPITRAGRGLAKIAVNYVIKDSDSIRETVQITKKGVMCYRTVKSITRTRKAAIIAKQASKSLARVAVMTSITKAIPYVNVVSTALDVLKVFVPDKSDRR